MTMRHLNAPTLEYYRDIRPLTTCPAAAAIDRARQHCWCLMANTSRCLMANSMSALFSSPIRHCTLYQYAGHSVHPESKVYIVHRVHCTVYSALYSIQFTVQYTVHCTVYSALYSIQCTVEC